jgi:localization factor PodJL
MQDKTLRAPVPTAAPSDDALELDDPSIGNRLSKRIKSLFVAASVIAIVVGGFQIASNYSNPFQSGGAANTPEPTATQTPSPIKRDTAKQDSGVAPETLSASPQLPGMIPQTSTFGLLAPNTTLPPPSQPAPVAAPPANAVPHNDVTGSLSPSQRYRGSTAAPAIGPPQSVPGEAVPIAIGGANLRNAAQRGDAGAAYEVAVRFAEGRGVATNIGESARWLERAAQAGLAPAQFRLGSLYEKGQGVKKDLEKARQNYAAAAAQGNAKAMHNLAVLYAEGLNGKPDFANASQWFQKAATRGVADSQYNLAVLYARGLGAGKNLGESYKWFALAAAQGDKDAARKRDDVAAQLDAKELAAAKQAVKAFTAEPQPPAAINVPQPAGGWDAAAPSASPEPSRARASAAVKLGRR